MKFVFGRVEIIVGNGENVGLIPAFSHFPTMFSKAFLFQGC